MVEFVIGSIEGFFSKFEFVFVCSINKISVLSKMGLVEEVFFSFVVDCFLILIRIVFLIIVIIVIRIIVNIDNWSLVRL